MRTLVVNCGSSSLKFKLYDLPSAEVSTSLAEGVVEEIGREKSKFTYKSHKSPNKVVLEVIAKDHTQAVAAMKDALLHPEYGLFKDKILVDAVGHRVVHGGEKFSNSALVTPGVRAAIEECIAVAPLHNPPNLAGIAACETIFPGLPQVAVFDTAFHQTMPPHVFLYGLPDEQYERYHIRKYGFHGTSHEYVARRCADLMKQDFGRFAHHLPHGQRLKHHGGQERSLVRHVDGPDAARRRGDGHAHRRHGSRGRPLHHGQGKAVAAGDEHPAQHKSGMKGLSGISNDMRQIEEKAASRATPAPSSRSISLSIAW